MNMLNAMPRNSRGAAVGHEGDGQPLSKAHVQPPQRDAVDFGSGGILRDRYDSSAQPIRRRVSTCLSFLIRNSIITSRSCIATAPCAMGAVINDATVPEITAKAICGLANNQLAEPRHGDALRARGIAYVPDYVVNGGGVRGAAPMIYSTPTREASKQSILRLHDTILAILAKADAEDRSSADVADDMARDRIAAGRR
jgi:leucine dehydrogenase